jgi:CMP-N,N'-diacetyllegionaminic acid synthase
MRRIAVICARGGSKGLPNKNLRLLGGVPLIVHTIRQALATSILDAVAVSSDSEAILEVAKQNGVFHLIKRPFELATDEASKVPVIRHCVNEVEKVAGVFDYVADLDCTTPIRLVEDIVNAFGMIERAGVSTLISGTPARKLPYFNLVERNSRGFVEISKATTPPIVRRQDAPMCYDMNASIHIWRRDVLFASDARFQSDTILFEMPFERSIDIDTEIEFEINESLMQRRGLL